MQYRFPPDGRQVQDIPLNKQLFMAKQFIYCGRFRPPFGLLVCRCVYGWSRRTVNSFLCQMRHMVPVRKTEMMFILAYMLSLNRYNRHIYRRFRWFVKIPTDLFALVHFLTSNKKGGKGFGRGLRSAITQLYFVNRTPQGLLEWCQRHRHGFGWTHRDIIKLAHIKFPQRFNFVETFLYYGRVDPETGTFAMVNSAMWGKPDAVRSMSCIKLLRSLGKLTANKTLAPFSEETDIAYVKILDSKDIPLPLLLLAIKIYSGGRGMLGKLKWTPVPQIVYGLRWKFQRLFPAVSPHLHAIRSISKTDWSFGSIWMTQGDAIHSLFAEFDKRQDTRAWFHADTILLFATKVQSSHIKTFKAFQTCIKRQAKMVVITTSEHVPLDCWTSSDIFVMSAFDSKSVIRACALGQ